MHKVSIVDCVKQIIAINEELKEHDQRQDYHVTWMAQLRDRIEGLQKRIEELERRTNGQKTTR